MGPPRLTDWSSATLPPPLKIGEGRAAVRMEVLPQGRHLVLLVGGGATHVGAVAVAEPDGAPARRLVRGRHKEGPLAAAAAERLAAAAGCACAAVAGIHQDRATPGEIAAIVANVERGVDELVRRLADLREAGA